MEIRAENISLSLGVSRILREVTMETHMGEFVGILGPNGSGKSTLLKCIYRVLRPDAGCIWIGDRELETMKVRESARRTAVVAQHNYYNFEFTVREVVSMGRAPHKKMLERDNAGDREITERALETVKMQEFADRDFSTLSGGEQQRVLLARALAQQTPCLILDEPTNHLDITHQLELMELVRGLKITVLCAVHDLNIAAMYCDRIYILKDGEIAGQGTPEEILTPDRIRQVYRVETEIVKDRKGRMHILFLENMKKS